MIHFFSELKDATDGQTKMRKVARRYAATLKTMEERAAAERSAASDAHNTMEAAVLKAAHDAVAEAVREKEDELEKRFALKLSQAQDGAGSSHEEQLNGLRLELRKTRAKAKELLREKRARDKHIDITMREKETTLSGTIFCFNFFLFIVVFSSYSSSSSSPSLRYVCTCHYYALLYVEDLAKAKARLRSTKKSHAAEIISVSAKTVRAVELAEAQEAERAQKAENRMVRNDPASYT